MVKDHFRLWTSTRCQAPEEPVRWLPSQHAFPGMEAQCCWHSPASNWGIPRNPPSQTPEPWVQRWRGSLVPHAQEGLQWAVSLGGLSFLCQQAVLPSVGYRRPCAGHPPLARSLRIRAYHRQCWMRKYGCSHWVSIFVVRHDGERGIRGVAVFEVDSCNRTEIPLHSLQAL